MTEILWMSQRVVQDRVCSWSWHHVWVLKVRRSHAPWPGVRAEAVLAGDDCELPTKHERQRGDGPSALVQHIFRGRVFDADMERKTARKEDRGRWGVQVTVQGHWVEANNSIGEGATSSGTAAEAWQEDGPARVKGRRNHANKPLR